MKSLETFLIRLDEPPVSAAWRILLGFAIPPAFSAIAGGNDRVLAYAALFLLLLAALRIGPALFRAALPFSADAQAKWKKLRFIAKEFDCYQWRKLFWIGLGMLPHAVIGRGLGWGGVALSAFCLIGGGAGLLMWRKLADRQGSRLV